MLARAAAAESGARLFILSPSNVVSDRMGVSEKTVGNAFRMAMSVPPALIFIDEFDSLFPSRELIDPGQLGGSLVSTICVAFDELKRWMRHRQQERDGDTSDKLGVVVLAASNRPDALDRALLQYGRFDYSLRINLPDKADRREQFGILLADAYARHAQWTVRLAPNDLEWLVERTVMSNLFVCRMQDILSRRADFLELILSVALPHVADSQSELQANLVTNAKQVAVDDGSSGLLREHFESAFRVSLTLHEEIESERRRCKVCRKTWFKC